MKKLPELYTNSFDKKIDNSQEFITITNKSQKEIKPLTKYEINNKIDKLFKSNNYIYKIKAEIKLQNKTIAETIIGKTKNNLITLNNELINIDDIKDIKKID